jgi:hypothetical protein
LGSDGNLYMGNEFVSATTEKERAVIRELEGSTSTSPSPQRGTGNGDKGVKSNNPVSGIKVTKEGGVGVAIDEHASVSKQTIQALRYLFKAGR